MLNGTSFAELEMYATAETFHSEMSQRVVAEQKRKPCVANQLERK